MKGRPFVKKVVIRVGRTMPIVDSYLREKSQMEKQMIDQAAELAAVIQHKEDLTREINQIRHELEQIKQGAENAQAAKKLIFWPRFEKDILAAEVKQPVSIKLHRKPPFTITWVLPTMEKASGGRADILRTVAYLEKKGHTCRLYFYDPSNSQTLDSIRSDIEDYHPKVKAELHYNAPKMLDSDIIFATNYYSAYPVYNHQGEAHKCYYVQDFEPYFELPGSYHVIAENTYNFGFRGITIGKWLAMKLQNEYGMQCDYFNFGVDPERYYITNQSRSGILLYARPSTPRRGFELAILALEIFHKKYPDQPIYTVGADISNYNIPFPYVNKGVLSLKELNDLYNQCYGGLAISLTNMSLLPLEMLAAGCQPIVNEAPNTTLVPYGQYIKFADTSPSSLADAMGSVVDTHTDEWARQASRSAHKYSWDESNDRIEKILINDLS